MWRVRPAAQYLGVHPKTLLRWIAKGRIGCLTVNGRHYFTAQTLADFVAGRKEAKENP
ncbi:MAG TPA: helix-turn-helix domain-containing protein [Phycisphaerae bacterium]|nr:helix-turn-helix domain-containing protein [Phycisphaerae bacterium]